MPSLPNIDGWKWQFDKPSGKWSLHQTHGSIADIIQRLTQSSAPQYDAGLLKSNNHNPRRISTGRQSIASHHSISPPASPVSFQPTPSNVADKAAAPAQIQPQIVNQPQFLQFPSGQQQIPPGYAILASNAAGQPYYIHYGQLPVQTTNPTGLQSPPISSPPLGSPPSASPLQRAATHHANVQRRPVSAQSSTQQLNTQAQPAQAQQNIPAPAPPVQLQQTVPPPASPAQAQQVAGQTITSAQTQTQGQQITQPEEQPQTQIQQQQNDGTVQNPTVDSNTNQAPASAQQQQPPSHETSIQAQDPVQQTQNGAPQRTASQRSELASSPRPAPIQTTQQQANAQQLPSIAQEDVVMPLASELVGQTPASPIETEANPAKPKVSRIRETPPPSYDTLHLMNYHAVPQNEPAELSALESQPFSHTHDRIPPQVYPMPPRTQAASSTPASPQQSIHQLSTSLYQQQWSAPAQTPGQVVTCSPPPGTSGGFPSPPTPHSVTQSLATPPPDAVSNSAATQSYPPQRPASVEQPQYQVFQNPPIVSPGPVAQPQINLNAAVPPMPPQLQHLNTAHVPATTAAPASTSTSVPAPPQSASPAASPLAPPLTHTVSAPQVLQADANHQPSVITQTQASRSRLSAIGKGVGNWAGKTAAGVGNWAEKNPKKLIAGVAAVEFVGAAHGIDVMGGLKTGTNVVNAYNKAKQRTQSVPQVQTLPQGQISPAIQTTMQVQTTMQQAGQSVPAPLLPGQSASPPGGVLPGGRNSLFFPSPTQNHAMPAAMAVRPLQTGSPLGTTQSSIVAAHQQAQIAATNTAHAQSAHNANIAQHQAQPLQSQMAVVPRPLHVQNQQAQSHIHSHQLNQTGQSQQSHFSNQAGHQTQTYSTNGQASQSVHSMANPNMANAASAVGQLIQSGERIYTTHHNSQQPDNNSGQHHHNSQDNSQSSQQAINYSADLQQQQLQQLQIQQQIAQLQAQQQYQQANPGQQQYYDPAGQIQYTNASSQPIYQTNQTIVNVDDSSYNVGGGALSMNVANKAQQSSSSVTIDPTIAVDQTSVVQLMQTNTDDSSNMAFLQQSIDPGSSIDVSGMVASADMTSSNDAVIDDSTYYSYDASY